MLDTMASRYHVLPSEIMQKADTLDVYVMDVALSWQEYQQSLAEKNTANKQAPHVPINKLQDMLAAVKNKQR